MTETAVTATLDKMALEPVLLDVSKQSSYTDFILIVSARSDRQVQAICDHVVKQIKEAHGRAPLSVEGKKEGQWALIDYGSFVVHVFYHPTRVRYDLEGLWHDAHRVPVEIPSESRIQVSDAYSL